MNCRCGLEGTYTRPGQNSLDNGKVDYISSLHRYGPPRRTKPVLVNMAVLQCPGLSWHYTHVCVLYTLVGDRKHRPSCYALTRLGGVGVFGPPRGKPTGRVRRTDMYGSERIRTAGLSTNLMRYVPPCHPWRGTATSLTPLLFGTRFINDTICTYICTYSVVEPILLGRDLFGDKRASDRAGSTHTPGPYYGVPYM